MFQTAWVHHQEGSLYTQFVYGMFFFCIYVSSLAGGRVCSMLMKNPRGSKHVEDVKNRIKA